MAWDSLWTNVHLATMAPPHPYGEIRNAALAVQDGKIAWLGPLSDLSTSARFNELVMARAEGLRLGANRLPPP